MIKSSPLILVAPSMRCFHLSNPPAPTVCGRPAVAIRTGLAWELPAFVCARHAASCDLPLPAEVAFRRVRLMAQVDFAGVTFSQRDAESEAVKRLERGVEDAGGLLTNVTAHSAIVRHRREEPAGGLDGQRGRG